MPKEYDVAIIGVGTAGLIARSQVAKQTDTYVVLDNGILGTTCARFRIASPLALKIT